MLNALFVIFGAALWATDTLFRHPLVHDFSPIVIVFAEHVVGTFITLTWVCVFHRKKIFLSWKALLGALFIGIFGSALATLLFTTSFEYTNPSISILLQKAQPIAVILLSYLFLGEHFKKRFWIWSAVALLSAFLISFPHGFSSVLFQRELSDSRAIKGSVFALIAAGCWALSTVSGKMVLKNTPSAVLTFWRYFFGLMTLSLFVFLYPQAKIELPFLYSEPAVLKSIFYMAAIPGFMGVTLYYRGLAKVPASIATLLELSFPLSALWINSHFLGFHLSMVQIAAAFMLIFSMIMVRIS